MVVRGAVLVLLVAAVAGCGGRGEEARVAADATPDRGTRLDITVDTGDGPPSSWTLTCDPDGGTHPEPGRACAALAAVDDPFAPVPSDMLCTQVYGGPQIATVRGTWRGRAVDARYQRTNGCEIARWDRLAAVFGTSGGVGGTGQLGTESPGPS
ncbi:MAG: subtilase-type protease inhibitor [Actinomycetota bacterium]|nr:subtilase-type protease inhibitor [Actinomycetota bacterium]